MARLKDVSPARLAAFEVLRQVERGAFSSVLLAAQEPQLQPLDRALTHELVLGVLRWQLLLDRIVEHYAKRKIDSLDVAVRIALRLGLYQLRFLTRIPPSAAVNESVSLVRSAKLSSATSFVNAILRRATREADYDPTVSISNPIEKLAVETSHPQWLIEQWIESFGIATAESFARANNQQPPTAFRILGNSETSVLQRLREAGGAIEPSQIVPNAWRITGVGKELRELTQLGQIYIQDEASQLVAHSLKTQSGDRVLDLCAAPGGKTTLLATNAGIVVAGDISISRLGTLGNSIDLQQLKNIQRLVIDASSQLPFSPQFDQVLVDAPCSGTGTLRHNPEIRWRLSPKDITSLASQQKKFLRNAAAVVKPGGTLVYSTCSVELEENEEVIRDFLTHDDRFVSDEFEQGMGSRRRTWPHIEGADGFFVALLRRTSQS